VVAFAVILVVLLVAVLLLIPFGFHAGDRPGDARLLGVEPVPIPRGVRVEVSNPSHMPVLIGISLRRRGWRAWLEGSSYARLRTRGTTADLLPTRQAVIGVLAPGQRETVMVPAGAALGPQAELVVVLGMPSRLRTVHRSVSLPSGEPGRPVAPPLKRASQPRRKQGARGSLG
jgi:hypothetical protein